MTWGWFSWWPGSLLRGTRGQVWPSGPPNYSVGSATAASLLEVVGVDVCSYLDKIVAEPLELIEFFEQFFQEPRRWTELLTILSFVTFKVHLLGETLSLARCLPEPSRGVLQHMQTMQHLKGIQLTICLCKPKLSKALKSPTTEVTGTESNRRGLQQNSTSEAVQSATATSALVWCKTALNASKIKAEAVRAPIQ
eukprot:762454-Amphidinium_carterae.1